MVEKSTVFENVCDFLTEELGCRRQDVTPQARIVEDLGADSLDIVELIATLEETYHIIITDERVRTLQTVGDIVTFIEKMIA
ncbi:MAG: acyl carrier protein [Oscillospiraceae bacterium]|nr:acyl carrier protein [Oscillospiraceae bacterium]